MYEQWFVVRICVYTTIVYSFRHNFLIRWNVKTCFTHTIRYSFETQIESIEEKTRIFPPLFVILWKLDESWSVRQWWKWRNLARLHQRLIHHRVTVPGWCKYFLTKKNDIPMKIIKLFFFSQKLIVFAIAPHRVGEWIYKIFFKIFISPRERCSDHSQWADISRFSVVSWTMWNFSLLFSWKCSTFILRFPKMISIEKKFI